jgi:RHS repeat-associated protein
VKVLNADGTQKPDPNFSSLGNGYLYTGRSLDKETALYFYRHRYLDPSLGSFVNRDPLGMEGGINLYAYTTNNPILFHDPNGLIKCEVTTTDLDFGFGYEGEYVWKHNMSYWGYGKVSLSGGIEKKGNEVYAYAHAFASYYQYGWFTTINARASANSEGKAVCEWNTDLGLCVWNLVGPTPQPQSSVPRALYAHAKTNVEFLGLSSISLTVKSQGEAWACNEQGQVTGISAGIGGIGGGITSPIGVSVGISVSVTKPAGAYSKNFSQVSTYTCYCAEEF